MANRPRVIVSFSTIPSRIFKIRPLINSLSRQSIKPDAIYLWVCHYYRRLQMRFYKKKLPKFLNKYPEIQIRWCEDKGPLTKIYATLGLENTSNAIIVTCDDEHLLPSHWLEGLVEATKKAPSCSFAYRGRRFRQKDGALVLNYAKSKIVTARNRPLRVDLLTGTMGAVYRRSFFSSSMMRDWHKAVMEKCPALFFNDDIWINGYLAQKKILRKVIPLRGKVKVHYLSDALWSINQRSLWDKEQLINKSGSYSNNDLGLLYFKKYW